MTRYKFSRKQFLKRILVLLKANLLRYGLQNESSISASNHVAAYP